MIGLFRKNDVVNIFMLLPYTVILRIHSLIHPTSYTVKEYDSEIVKFLYSWINYPIAQSIIAIILVFLQANMINMIVNNHRLHRQPTALSGMIYVLLASALGIFQELTPALIGLTFVLIAIINVFRTYKQTMAAESIFNASLGSAAAAVIYYPYLFVLIALFIGLGTMRNFKLVERFQFITGYFTLLWIVGSLFYFFDVLTPDLLNSFSFFGTIKSIPVPSGTILIAIGLLVICLLVSLGNYYNYMKKKGIEIRKKIDFFYWLLFCSLLAFIFMVGLEAQFFYFAAIPLAVFLSMSLTSIRNHALAELFHFIILGAVFYFQFA